MSSSVPYEVPLLSFIVLRYTSLMLRNESVPTAHEWPCFFADPRVLPHSSAELIRPSKPDFQFHTAALAGHSCYLQMPAVILPEARTVGASLLPCWAWHAQLLLSSAPTVPCSSHDSQPSISLESPKSSGVVGSRRECLRTSWLMLP